MQKSKGLPVDESKIIQLGSLRRKYAIQQLQKLEDLNQRLAESADGPLTVELEGGVKINFKDENSIRQLAEYISKQIMPVESYARKKSLIQSAKRIVDESNIRADYKGKIKRNVEKAVLSMANATGDCGFRFQIDSSPSYSGADGSPSFSTQEDQRFVYGERVGKGLSIGQYTERKNGNGKSKTKDHRIVNTLTL